MALSTHMEAQLRSVGFYFGEILFCPNVGQMLNAMERWKSLFLLFIGNVIFLFGQLFENIFDHSPLEALVHSSRWQVGLPGGGATTVCAPDNDSPSQTALSNSPLSQPGVQQPPPTHLPLPCISSQLSLAQQVDSRWKHDTCCLKIDVVLYPYSTWPMVELYTRLSNRLFQSKEPWSMVNTSLFPSQDLAQGWMLDSMDSIMEEKKPGAGTQMNDISITGRKIK